VADEAYRAVFLRVHPTGKMVLSLTTQADGRENDYAAIVAEELGVPPLDVKVVPADENRFGTGHGFNTSPSPGTAAAVASTAGRIRDKARLLAGAAMAAEEPQWADGAFTADGESQTIADLALYAHGSGQLPPGVEGGLDAQTVYRD
jgi:carbon-monoxide dehydrogenase large subunit